MHRFPTKTKPAISVIHSRSQEAQGHEDFRQPLCSLKGTVLLDPIPTSMVSVPELVQAVRRGAADLLVPIRGGGSEEQFDVFDRSDWLNAWAEKRAYRVVGIGHSTNTTAFDLFSNFVATTPAAVGTHIADLIKGARETQRSLEAYMREQTVAIAGVTRTTATCSSRTPK